MLQINPFHKIVKDNTIAIIGAGSWGSAIAQVLTDNGKDVLIWAYEKEVTFEINKFHSNLSFLKNVKLNSNIYATNNLDEAFDKHQVIISAIPTQFIRRTLSKYQGKFNDKYIINISKGIEQSSLQRISCIYRDLGLPDDNYAILTGPSHAEEVSRRIPTTVVASSEDVEYTSFIQEIFSNDNFRVYSSNDTIGCELGGALKNIIAIASGIIDGLQLGDNTKAALITRGLAEINRLSITLGANPQTLSGLAGLGDLYVTCSSKHSRNRKVGELIGRGQSLEDIQKATSMVAEGVATTKAVFMLSEKHQVEMPIIHKTYQILFENLDPLTAIKQLMTRTSKNEWW